MYTIGICDDGKNVCAVLEQMINEYGKQQKMQVETLVWFSGEELCHFLKQGNQLDILFLDIELLEMTGIEVGDFIRNQLDDRTMQIIYISNKETYARKLFKTQPVDFLVKPISQKQVNETLDLAVKLIGRSAGKFEYQYGRDFFYIPYNDIMYFTSEGRKIIIAMPQDKREFNGKLGELEKHLSEDFIMIHQSYIINRRFVSRYTYETVELQNGEKLPISKTKRKEIRERFLREE